MRDGGVSRDGPRFDVSGRLAKLVAQARPRRARLLAGRRGVVRAHLLPIGEPMGGGHKGRLVRIAGEPFETEARPRATAASIEVRHAARNEARRPASPFPIVLTGHRVGEAHNIEVHAIRFRPENGGVFESNRAG